MYATSEIGHHTAPDGTIVNEMLRCDVYEVPPDLRDEQELRISPAYMCCPYCARLGETLAEIPHDAGCPMTAQQAF